MSWNYRLMRHSTPIKGTDQVEIWFGIHEIYGTSPEGIAYSEQPTNLVGENVEDIKWALEEMLKCLEKPVLDYNEDD